MYLLAGILLLAGLFFSVFCFYRKKGILCKLCCMDPCMRTCKLNALTLPFGFYYLPSQNIMTSALDAWQRDFGYHALFDKTAPRFQIVVDCEPVYFDYGGKTWLIEFWKGQYGINTGGEIGVYRAPGIVPPEAYDKTLFQSVPDESLLQLSMDLYYRGKLLFRLRQCHWWLTGFCMGLFTEPEELTMKVSVTFPNGEMQRCFTEAMVAGGYTEQELTCCETGVEFWFCTPKCRQPRKVRRCRSRFSQWKNRLFCRIFNKLTKRFPCTSEKLLYLYYLIPGAFRHTLTFRKNRRQKCRPGKRRRT